MLIWRFWPPICEDWSPIVDDWPLESLGLGVKRLCLGVIRPWGQTSGKHFNHSLESLHRLQTLSSHIQNTNQQPTYLYNSFSTRSSDSLVLSIPYVRSSLGKRAFSVIGPRLWNSLPRSTTLEFTTSWYPKFIFFTNIPFQAQNTPLQNCIPSLGSFPSPWTVYLDFDSCYSHFMPYRMTLSAGP